MKLITNPPRANLGYNCYGCAPHNPRGLHLQFFEDGDEIVGVWKPHPDFQSYENIVHGGVQMALMDETACWVMMVKVGTAGFTQTMRFSFLKHVYVNQKEIQIRGKLVEIKGGIAYIELRILDPEGEVRTTALAEYFVVPEKIALRRLQYPGKEAFGI
ncbi:MAG: PaaI family thioesterase [Bacteroidales bacterium]|jgi:acyl-coenzyme A thioesterase PaaI-like protein|nr:PaaI family thioesterase [Bacteroidales bacterium]NPV35847.1 PaaI family thioesterase [Bacteroidales bacterium]